MDWSVRLVCFPRFGTPPFSMFDIYNKRIALFNCAHSCRLARKMMHTVRSLVHTHLCTLVQTCVHHCVHAHLCLLVHALLFYFCTLTRAHSCRLARTMMHTVHSLVLTHAHSSTILQCQARAFHTRTLIHKGTLARTSTLSKAQPSRSGRFH